LISSATEIVVGIILCVRSWGSIGEVAITSAEYLIVNGDISAVVSPYILVVSLYILQGASKENQGPKIPIKTKTKPIKAPTKVTVLLLTISYIQVFAVI